MHLPTESFSKQAVDHYDALGQNTFRSACDHTQLKVTPFTFPAHETGPRVFSYDGKTRQIVTIEEYAYFFDLPLIVPAQTFILPEVEEVVRKTALHAAGGYGVLCQHAAKKYGRGCGVTSRLQFYVYRSDGPSVADPAGIIPGWVSYRLKFAACPQECLSTLK